MLGRRGQFCSHAAARTRRLLAAYRGAEDLINIGAYQPGSNPEVDRAIEKRDALLAFLAQGISERWSLERAVESLQGIVGDEDEA